MQTFSELNPEDLAWCVKRMPKKVQSVLKSFPAEVSIAGGYIRSCITGDTLHDIDLFVKSEIVAADVDKLLRKEDQKVFKTKNAYTILRGEKPPIQVIFRWVYERPELVLNDLDFTICCASIWYEHNRFKSAVHPMYYADLAAKRLRYTSPSRIEETGGSLLRVLKYYNKNYRIMLSSFAKTIARACSGVKQISAAIDEEKLAHILNGVLVEVDPNAVNESFFIDDSTEEDASTDINFDD